MTLSPRTQIASRISLSILWIFTGLTSLFWAKDIGYQVLSQGGVEGILADVAVLCGSVVDITIGLWLLSNWRLSWCFKAQLIIITAYTVLLTIMAPSFWLHPFGPLSKNIPLACFIYILLQDSQTGNARH